MHSTTDLDAMRSLGISLNGPDPLPQQLEELDAQSRLMCGIQQSSNGSKTPTRLQVTSPKTKPLKLTVNVKIVK